MKDSFIKSTLAALLLGVLPTCVLAQQGSVVGRAVPFRVPDSMRAGSIQRTKANTVKSVAYQDPNGPHSLFGNPFSDEPVGSVVVPSQTPQAAVPQPGDIQSYPAPTPTPQQVGGGLQPVPAEIPIAPTPMPSVAPVAPAPAIMAPVTPAPVATSPAPAVMASPMIAPTCGAATCCAPSCGAAGPSCGAAGPSCGLAAPSCGAPGCDDCGGGCGSSCGLGLCDCNLGDAFTLSGLLHGDCPPAVTIGGWFSAGYHSKSNELFNSRPDNFALHQGWLYAEKVADGSSPFGFRVDVMYGIDADDTQAFGNPSGSWDYENGFDHGAYGWAIPQAYVEVALTDSVSVKAGHFYTLVGYEVVTAPDNFFYSHAMTMYNSEPFTHTGVLATAGVGDNITLYGGWTLGWDTGFDQLNNGSSFLGGMGLTLTDDAAVTYIATAGNFGWRGDDAYSHSVVFDLTLTEKLNYVIQSDLVRVESTGEDNVGLNQYLLYSISDCLGFGTRVEWWKGDVLTGYAPHGASLPADGSLSYYAATFGANIRPHANLVVRPEVRIDWSPAADYDESYFGVDAIFTF